MTLVPLVVLFGIVIFAFGGPASFMTVVAGWGADLFDYALRLLKSL